MMSYRGFLSVILVFSVACNGTGAASADSDARHETPRLYTVTAAQPASAIPAPSSDPQLGHYLDGLEEMRAGHAREAVPYFDRVLMESPGDSRSLLARAVARLLSEDLAGAKQDLLRLGRRNRHAQLWKYAYATMTGEFTDLTSVPQRMRDSYR